MSLLIPKDFKKVAETNMSGTGDMLVKAYYNASKELYIMSLEYSVDEYGETRKIESMLGPFNKLSIKPLLLTLTDLDKGPLSYL